jgi:hypothetical protein
VTSLDAATGLDERLGDDASATAMPGVLMVVIEIMPESEAPGAEALLHQWYDEEHIADRLAVPGFRSVRRFKAADGSPRFLALWDVDDARLPMSAEYLNLPKTESAITWSERLRDIRVSVTRSAWVELPVPDGASDPRARAANAVDTPPPGWVKQPGVFAVMMGIKPEDEPDFHRWYNEEHIGDLLSRPGWLAVRRFQALNEQRFVALWEMDDVHFQQRPDRAQGQPSAWTKRIGEYRTSVERTAWTELPVKAEWATGPNG